MAYKDPTCSCLASLFIRLLVEDLNEFAYNAEISGISYNISLSVYGIIVSNHRLICYKFVAKTIHYSVLNNISTISAATRHLHDCMSLQVQISGYNHKQPILLSKIMSKLSKFTVDDKQFEIEKEVLTRQLRNFKAEQPHTHAKYYLSLLTDNMAWTKEELASAVEGTCTCLCKFGCYMYT